MEESISKKKRPLLIVLIALVSVVATTFIAFGIYVGDYYHADDAAIEAFAYDESKFYESTDNDGNRVFAPKEPVAGFIFYPGGKVDEAAYVPLMRALAERGILCVLINMPFNLAIFDTDAAEGIKESFDVIEKWYIGGHSLGGSAAAMYVDENRGAFDGLVLLAAYSNVDLSDTGMDVISIYGSEDKVLDLEKYQQYRENLPADFTEEVISGGCHAYFGMYGLQAGDGIPRISAEEQIELTVNVIVQGVVGGAQDK